MAWLEALLCRWMEGEQSITTRDYNCVYWWNFSSHSGTAEIIRWMINFDNQLIIKQLLKDTSFFLFLTLNLFELKAHFWFLENFRDQLPK